MKYDTLESTAETPIGPVELHARIDEWPLTRPFRIAGKTYPELQTVVVEISRGTVLGRGEAIGVDYIGESAASILDQIEACAPTVSANANRQVLQSLLPPGGARNALDCALWDIESRILGQSVWARLNVDLKPVDTVFTLGLQDTLDAYADSALEAEMYAKLKVKLDARNPVGNMRAVRRARPDADLIVDVNEGWSFAELTSYAPALADLGVLMIEHPLPRGADAELAAFDSPVPICADESCLHQGELDRLSRGYRAVNVKLDKTGGLTEALKLADAASERGYLLMIGNMMGTSLAMAPALMLAHRCAFVDLDGPLLAATDRPMGLRYEGGTIHVPEKFLWGQP